MRVPQVSDRIKEAPAQALRGVFAGIGQVLLVADRLRNKTPAAQQAPPAPVPEPSVTREDPATPAAPTPPAPPTRMAPPTPTAPPTRTAPPTPTVPAAARAERVTEARDLDKTGNVRLLTSEEARAGQTAPTVDATVTAGEEQGAPLPNYDELSIASLRARLRNLDAAQVKQLAEYEKTHAARTDVMTMFERRIAKLEAQTSAAADARAEAEAEAEVEAREEVADEVRAEVAAEAEDEA